MVQREVNQSINNPFLKSGTQTICPSDVHISSVEVESAIRCCRLLPIIIADMQIIESGVSGTGLVQTILLVLRLTYERQRHVDILTLEVRQQLGFGPWWRVVHQHVDFGLVMPIVCFSHCGGQRGHVLPWKIRFIIFFHSWHVKFSMKRYFINKNADKTILKYVCIYKLLQKFN